MVFDRLPPPEIAPPASPTPPPPIHDPIAELARAILEGRISIEDQSGNRYVLKIDTFDEVDLSSRETVSHRRAW